MMLTIREAMELTHLPYYTIRKMCIEGKVQFVRSGTKFYLCRESLEAYLRGDTNCSQNS